MGSKGGRPRRAIKRDRQISVRLTEDQYAALLTRAGHGSVSAFVRTSMLEKARRSSVPVPAINRTAWAEFSRTASNLSQLTHHANCGRFAHSGKLARVLLNLHEDLERLRLSLIGGRDGHR